MLPTDFSRSSQSNGNVSRCTLALPSALVKKLHEVTETDKSSWRPFAYFGSVYAVIVYRRTRENDLSLSIRAQAPIVNPSDSTAKQTQAARLYVDESTLFGAVLQSVEEAGTVFAQPPHSIVFSTSNGSVDISFVVTPSSDGFDLALEYNPELFRKETVEETLEQTSLLLAQVLEFNKNILEYNLITERGRALLPPVSEALDAEWRGPITECFERQAKANPTRTAVIYKEEEVSYAALSSLSNRLANALIEAGIRPGDVIGLFGHRSPAVVWAIMGVLKAGAAYTMMDPKYPVDRIETCLTIANIKGWIQIDAAGDIPSELDTFLSSRGLSFRISLPATSDTVVQQGGFLTNFSTTAPEIKIEKDSIAVVTFTSGSTGIPKGVMGRHVPLTHFYPWMATRFGISASDRFSMCSGIAHDPLQRDIFTPLFFGASVAIPTDQEVSEPGQLARWFKQQAITVTCLTPAMGQLLTSEDNPGFELQTLRNAFFVGDCLIKRDVLKLKRLAPAVHCINMYGSTETQRAVGYIEIIEESELSSMKEVIPVGKGMKDVQLIILNQSGKLTGVGELGEIYVRSPHLAYGYIASEEVNREKFIINPFHPHYNDAEKSRVESAMELKEDRLYKTGDLGRYMITGDVECAGRADDQVKIRGFRIELGEINAFLSKHPLVKENITMVREDSPGQKLIVSYVVPTDGAKECKDVISSPGTMNIRKLVSVLRAHLRDHLPNYMVPSAIVILASMPLTPNGKINRAGVPKPDMGLHSEEQNHDLTPLEEILTKVWAASLNVNTVSVSDNFFDLGGHSLLATQLTLRMKQALGESYNVQMKMLFQYPTVAELAKALTQSSQKDENSQSVPDFALDVDTLAKELSSPSGAPLDPNRPVQAVLLTGATGFLGGYLLESLLRNTEAQVYCPCRAESPTAALDRLKQNLLDCSLWREDYDRRIVPLVADLGKPQLGLPDKQWSELADSIDIIVHNGAMVHWLLPYAKLRAPNVLGTLELLRLSGLKRMKTFHHVSSTSVFDTTHHKTLSVVTEKESIEHFKGLGGGYPQSKWVAERLVLYARTQGYHTAIYRPGYISGDSVRGLWNTDDFLCRLIKGCVQLQACPVLDSDKFTPAIDMGPVDYVADAITTLSLQPSSANKDYHVVNPTPYPYERLFDRLRSFGYPLSALSYAEWREKLLETVARESSEAEANALAPVVSQFSENWPAGLYNPVYDMANVREGLKNASSTLACPSIEQTMLPYVTYMVSCGFLERPAQVSTASVKLEWPSNSSAQRLTRLNRSQ